MSKLSEKIRQASRPQSQGLGFGASRGAISATMVLAATARDAGDVAALVRAGADVVVIGSRESQTRAVPSGEATAPLGAWITGSGGADAAAYKSAGFDFVVFDPDRVPATALLEENVGYVMRLPGDLGDAELRTLEGFQLDAIDVGAIEIALTVRRQIELRRLASMTKKPLMASVRPDISVAELRALRETNVAVITAGRSQDVERLRNTIDALPPRSHRKDGEDRPTPLVPRSVSAGDELEEEDDD